MSSNGCNPFPSFLTQIRIQGCSLFCSFDEIVERLGQQPMFSVQLINQAFESWLSFSHLVHVTVMLLEPKMVEDMRARGFDNSANYRNVLIRTSDGVFELLQVLPESLMCPTQGFGNRGFFCHKRTSLTWSS